MMTQDIAANFDAETRTIATNPFLRHLWAQAWGDLYPMEAEPLSTTSWVTLGQLVAALRMSPDQVLVDLGCGRAGPSLWLARAFGARLIGIDHSPAFVRMASAWADQWLPEGKAEFHVGTLTETGLPDASVDALFSNAVALGQDVDAALAEISRIVRHGGRVAFSHNEDRDRSEADQWRERLTEAGMVFEARYQMDEANDGMRRLAGLIKANQDRLVAELGETAAGYVLNDADTYEPLLDNICWALVVAHRA
jgi:SAM-dependent methyltransferase